jgi:ribosome-binding factor A
MGNPVRLERLQKEILREVSRIVLQELNDPRVAGVTFTRVTLTPDLREATVYGTAFGGLRGWRRAAGGLARARGYIQSALGDRLAVRHSPAVAFAFDAENERAARMEELFHAIERERIRDEERAEKSPDRMSGSSEIATKTPSHEDAPRK